MWPIMENFNKIKVALVGQRYGWSNNSERLFSYLQMVHPDLAATFKIVGLLNVEKRTLQKSKLKYGKKKYR